MLACGHPCPSGTFPFVQYTQITHSHDLYPVCGEPCSVQQCPQCLPDEKKNAIVDFIMQRTLSELDFASTDVTERIITLSCGHFFTVETLDGHCHMSDFYDVEPESGLYRAMKAPPVDFQTPPTCPTCRGPITALRYGRVTKRANLDILERNVASQMTKQLGEAARCIEELVGTLPQTEAAARSMKAKSLPDADLAFETIIVKRQKNLRAAQQDLPLPIAFLLNANHHGFSGEEAKEWRGIIGPFSHAYKLLFETARTRGPHVGAYEAALATLYHIELASILGNVERISDEPEPDAMVAANKKMGQPPHRADTRYQVEAFLMSVSLRVRIAHIARCRIESLPVSSPLPRRVWCSFVEFIYETCLDDANKAAEIARTSAASRQVARSEIAVLEIQMFAFAFDIMCQKEDYARGGNLTAENRQPLVLRIHQDKTRMAAALSQMERAYVNTRPTQTISDLIEERKWWKENAKVVAAVYRDEYDELEDHVKSDKGYTPLSLQEMTDVVKALNFGQTLRPLLQLSSTDIYFQGIVVTFTIARMGTPS